MGDIPEGSSTAAQGAQKTSNETEDGSLSIFDWALRRRSRKAGEAEVRPATELDQASAAGARQMLVNLRNMRSLRLEDVAIPRADIVAVADDIALDDLVAVFRESGYSRIPVFNETLDNPLGLVHLKDIALEYAFGESSKPFDIKTVLRSLIYAPPSMPIGVLLQKMQSERIHMALVIDEYGGADGLLTMEDLVEQIVGEISDEHDTDDDHEWTREAAGIYRTTARADLQKFETEAGVDLLPDDLDEDVDTLGGLVFMLAGRVPVRGEVVRHPQGHEFEVLDADARRVKRMRVTLKDAGSQNSNTQRRAAE